jgi:putative aldouronate transport system substrate-binding protein
MKKLLVLLICFTLMFNLVLAGCDSKGTESGSKTETETKTDTQTSQETKTDGGETASGVEPLTLPIVDPPGSVTLTWGTYDNWYTPASYTQNLEIFQAIEKDTGVKIIWDVVPSSQYTTTMQTRLAVATDLPDFINVPGDVVKYASDGLLIPIDDLINKYAPNILKYFEADPLTRKVLTAPDGHIYSLTSVVTGTGVSDPYAWIVRKDWLDRVGMAEPTTIDEFYKMLKAFKDQDANGNGNPNDEIPLVTRYGVRDLARFGDSWGLHFFYSYGFQVDESGKVIYEWMDPRAKELITWLNKLYSEGLIDPEFLTTKDDERLAKITRNIVGASTHFINAIEDWDKVLREAGIADVNHIAVVPPVGPNGYKGHHEAYGPISGHFSITKDCKEPVVAIKWLDYVYASEQGFLYTTFGIEGKSYEMVNGEPQFTEWATNHPEGLPLASAIRSLGALPNIPYIRSDVGFWSKQNLAFIAHLPKTKEMAEKISPYVKTAYPPIMSTAEEAQELTALMTEINTYRDEMLAKFIMGQESLDNWDTFVSTLKSMGMDEVLKIKQQQYDRFNKE